MTPICVGGVSIALLFQYIASIPRLTFGVFISLFSAVFLCFAVIGLSLPLMVAFSRFIPDGVRSGLKSISLFLFFQLVLIFSEAVLPTFMFLASVRRKARCGSPLMIRSYFTL